MRQTTIVCACFTLLVFCSYGIAFAQGTASSLYGVWKIDNRRTYEAMKAAGGHDVLTAYFAEDAIHLLYEFRSDGRVKTEAGLVGVAIDAEPSTSAGTWKVVDERDGLLTLKLDIDEDENKGKASVRFLDANTIRMEDLDSEFQRRHPIIFRRSTSESPAGN